MREMTNWQTLVYDGYAAMETKHKRRVSAVEVAEFVLNHGKKYLSTWTQRAEAKRIRNAARSMVLNRHMYHTGHNVNCYTTRDDWSDMP